MIICALSPRGHLPGSYLIAIVTTLLFATTPFEPVTWSCNGMAHPVLTSLGNRTLTCHKPTNPGASPANSGENRSPPIATLTGLTARINFPNGAAFPGSTAESVAPNPVAKISMDSPGCAGRELGPANPANNAVPPTNTAPKPFPDASLENMPGVASSCVISILAVEFLTPCTTMFNGTPAA